MLCYLSSVCWSLFSRILYSDLFRERGDNRLFFYTSPQSFILLLQLWGLFDLLVQVGSVILIWRRGNFVCNYWGCHVHQFIVHRLIPSDHWIYFHLKCIFLLIIAALPLDLFITYPC